MMALTPLGGTQAASAAASNHNPPHRLLPPRPCPSPHLLHFPQQQPASQSASACATLHPSTTLPRRDIELPFQNRSRVQKIQGGGCIKGLLAQKTVHVPSGSREPSGCAHVPSYFATLQACPNDEDQDVGTRIHGTQMCDR